MRTHEITAGSDTVHWGYFDYRLKPVLKIASGDRLIVHAVTGQPDLLPSNPKRYPTVLTEIHAKVRHGAGPHILVGPVDVEGARPGDVLEVEIEDIKLWQDWAYNMMMPLLGALPEDYPKASGRIIDIDLKTATAEVLPGRKIPLRPFFGIMAVAPPKELGEIPSNPPYLHGGNMDNKELVAGSYVYFPVWRKGAGFSLGDGHGAQGDGEVDLTAVETSLTGTFRLTVRKDMKLRWPRAETRTHYITMGFDRDLNAAAKMALREMIDFLCTKARMSREDAYVFSSVAVDLRITQLVNPHKGVHAMVLKELLR